MGDKPKQPTGPYGLKPVTIEMADSSNAYDDSNKIHKWYTIQRSIESMKMSVANLKLQIEATEKTIADRERLLHGLRMDALSATDPVQEYVDKNK